VLKDTVHRLFDLISEHLSRPIIMKISGGDYALILADYLLENDDYRKEMTRKQWEQLSSLLINGWLSCTCEDSVPNLRAIAQLILHAPPPGFGYAQNSFKFFKLVWEREKRETRATNILLMAMNSVLEQVYMKNSLTALDFVSTIIEDILTFWETKTVVVKWNLIKLLKRYFEIILLTDMTDVLPKFHSHLVYFSEMVLDDIVKLKWHPGYRNHIYKLPLEDKCLTNDFIHVAASCLVLEYRMMSSKHEIVEDHSFVFWQRMSHGIF
jgi:hypothetical protein